MNTYDELLGYINELKIVDTHEHLPMEHQRPQDTDVLIDWLQHYFNCDLVSAGALPSDIERVRDPKTDLMARWKIVEPFWHAACSTGYGRALDLAARDLYGVDGVCADTILELNDKFQEAQKKKGRYAEVLQEKAGIAVSIRDTMPMEKPETDDAFVFTLRVDPLVSPFHRSMIKEYGDAVGIKVHSLQDWMAVTKAFFDQAVADERRVTLKLGLAYTRSLFFDKVSVADAEDGFNEFFSNAHSPEWRPHRKASKALGDYMMHYICKLADEQGFPFQIHTGIQEGYGNVITDSNPTHLTNIFLEYGDVKFDIFHMSYPYMMELSNLAKNFRCVNIDMCWGHIISPEAARRAIVEWLDAVPANKISAFGGDYCFVDGVYGHQKLARANVAAAMAQKIADGTMDMDRAKEIAGWMFVDNPSRIFGLEKWTGV